MKNNHCIKPWSGYAVMIGILAVFGTGCSQQQKDIDIKGMIASSAKQEIGFAGVSFTVKDGKVTLEGSCPSQKQKEKVITRVNNTNGVKDVVDHIQIAPVVLDGDLPLQQSVDSVLMKYATAVGHVQDSVITVKGGLVQKEFAKLQKSLTDLHPKGVNPQLAQKQSSFRNSNRHGLDF